jgi:hypothetical protein
MQIRKRSWVLASAFLLGFCWLGYAAVSYRALYQGLETGLPVAQKFATEYGRTAFPLFGFMAATAIIMADVLLLNKRVLWALLLAFGVLIIACRVLLMPGLIVTTGPIPS